MALIFCTCTGLEPGPGPDVTGEDEWNKKVSAGNPCIKIKLLALNSVFYTEM
jgi:hypothetical protein